MEIASKIVYIFCTIILILFIFFEDYLPASLVDIKIFILWGGFICIILVELYKRKKKK